MGTQLDCLEEENLMARSKRNQSESFRKESEQPAEKKQNSKNKKNNFSANRNRRGNRRNDKKFELNVKDSDVNMADLKEAENDVEWYTFFKQLSADAGRIGFSWPLGNRIEHKTNLFSSSSQKPAMPVFANTAVPGIMAIYWTPTIGEAADFTSPINVASQKLFAYQAYDISRTLSYNAPDLMLMVLAMGEAYSYYAMMCRAYGRMMAYDPNDKYTPYAEMQAMGLDYNDLASNLADFRYYINLFASRLASVNVPADIAYIKRHIWMNLNIFQDSSTTKAQEYMYVQKNYYVYSETAYDTGGALILTPFITGSARKLKSIIDYGNNLLNAILASESVGLMSSDVLKTFTPNNIFVVNQITDDFKIYPEYSQEVLSQIENLTVVGDILPADDSDAFEPNIIQRQFGIAPILTTSPATVIYDGLNDYPQLAAAATLSCTKFLNMHKDDVSSDDVMVASRLSVLMRGVIKVTKSLGAATTPLAVAYGPLCGTELVNTLKIFYNAWTMNSTNTAYIPSIKSVEFDGGELFTAELGSVNLLLNKLTRLSAFDWHPTIPILITSTFTGGTQSDTQVYYPLLDTDNYALLNEHELQKLHEAAVLSEFAVKKAWEVNNPN